jgi:hypothetical protein
MSHAWPKGRINNYIAYLKPIGYPDTSSICGLCDNPGFILIDKSDKLSYQSGKRIFDGPNMFTRMKADDSGIYT